MVPVSEDSSEVEVSNKPHFVMSIKGEKVDVLCDNVEELLNAIPEDDDDDLFSDLVSPKRRKKELS